MLHAGSRFLAGGAAGHGEAAPGDYLQTNYRLWLVGHQLAHGRAPWLDPYTFQPEVSPLPNFAGWPFGLPYWPLHALFGDVGGWNAFVLLTYVLAGSFAFLWLRSLELPFLAALAGGLAFALAPYRVDQSVGHLLGPISVLLPLALWGIESRRLWLVVAATASIPLSGQAHLALGTTPFVVLYALLRSRERRVWIAALAGAGLAAAAGLAYEHLIVAGSIDAGGRSLAEVRHYQATWLDFVVRRERHGSESFVFLGWATPLAALAGAALLARARRWRLLVLLAIAVAVPCLLALGTNLPLYATVWHHFAPLRFPRVPERLMPIACLGIAALAAVFVARLRPALAVLAVVAVAADLHFGAYVATASGPGQAAYAALDGRPAGRLLELPVFLPDADVGGVYLYYDMTARRERPLGYALGPASTDGLARKLKPLTCGDWTDGALLGRLGVRYVAVHAALYPARPNAEWFAWRALERHGLRPLARDGRVTMFGPAGRASVAAPPEPPRAAIVRCGGWHHDVVSYPPGELWAYGGTTLTLRLDATAPALVSLDGGAKRRVLGARTLRLPLAAGAWHRVRIDKAGHGRIRLLAARRG
ncbi:MAG TPA: hypothetical protein VFL66_04785 [Gaiellaceae bacterium]|nr:hypothetical protein [Gaiellaceae bacterium]